jgi:ribosomal RNA-processing protein 36
VRDPRFETLSAGQYSEERFKKRYAFLYDDKLPAEREELRGALRKAKGAAARAELQARLTRVEQQLRSEEARRKQQAFKQQLKSAEHGAVREGKRPFYLKKSEQRRLELLARYEELQASGKLEQYMAKRRKRNAAKDHRYLPGGRRPGGGDDGDEQ